MFAIGEIKRPNLVSQGGGFITVTNLLAKIGGQTHFKTSLSVAIPALTANTLYMVYAVLSGGAPTLVISTNVNSVGPAGFTAWDLVSAFYSNGLASVGFGSLVNVQGVPETGPINWLSTPTIPGGTNPTKATIVLDRAVYVRRGTQFFGRHELQTTGVGSAGSGGDSIYRWSLPGVTVDSNFMTVTGGNGRQSTGPTFLYNAGILGSFGAVQPGQDGTSFVYMLNNSAQRQGSGLYALSNTDSQQGCSFEFPISNWTNTPLKDL